MAGGLEAHAHERCACAVRMRPKTGDEARLLRGCSMGGNSNRERRRRGRASGSGCRGVYSSEVGESAAMAGNETARRAGALRLAPGEFFGGARLGRSGGGIEVSHRIAT